MFFWNKKKVEQTPALIEEKVKEFNPFGLNDVLHYIKRETGVDLFSKNTIIEISCLQPIETGIVEKIRFEKKEYKFTIKSFGLKRD